MSERITPTDAAGTDVLLVGLTGGIATGKSSVAGMFRELGASVIDADAIVHRLLAPGGDAVEPIVDAFGEDVKYIDGIDRRKLASVVFGDDEARARLEAIVHPLVQRESREAIRERVESGETEIVMYDAALLVETGRHDEFHRLVVVFAQPDVQLERLMKRDGLDADQAGARIRAQLPLQRKVDVADYVIDNSGHWQQTRNEVSRVYALLNEDRSFLRDEQDLPDRRSSSD